MSKISDLLEAVGPSASKMTNCLAEIGDGDMHKGIIRLHNTGETEGKIKGSIYTTAIIAAGVTIYKLSPLFKKKYDELKKHRAEKKKITSTLEKYISEDGFEKSDHDISGSEE